MRVVVECGDHCGLDGRRHHHPGVFAHRQQFGDEGAKVLAGLKLRELSLEGTGVTAAGVRAYFPRGVDLILDGGTTPGGAPSTLLDLTVDPPRILRQGAVVVRDL